MPLVLDPARTAQHRYAALLEGGIIDIFDFKPGSRVVCIECRRPMVARQGERKLWHFGHKADSNHSCSPETVLHRLAKTFIHEGFTSARREQRSYPLCWPCPRCGKLHIALFGEPARMLLCEELQAFLRAHNVSFGAVWVSPERPIFRSATA